MLLPTEIVDMILIYTNDISIAIKLNNIHVIKKIFNSKIHTWYWACENNKVDLIKLLHTKGFSIYKETGNTEILKFFYNYNFTYNIENELYPIDIAAKNGHLEVVKYLHCVGKYGDKCTINLAAKNGHLEVVKYLHDILGMYNV